MRPINRGASPRPADYTNYRDAFVDLVSRLGPYCSYCERHMPTNLAVEHIQPKAPHRYPQLVGRWDNYLLGCVNCNGSKGDRDVVLADVLLPDRDNTAEAYAYTPDGKVEPSDRLNSLQRQMAAATLALCGLDKGPNQATDADGKMVAIDRYEQRMQMWGMALSFKEDLAGNPSVEVRRGIVKAALGHGFFSIWMQVFTDDAMMRRLLIDGFMQSGVYRGFPGTASDCFDATGHTVSPRPGNGLPSGSKI